MSDNEKITEYEQTISGLYKRIRILENAMLSIYQMINVNDSRAISAIKTNSYKPEAFNARDIINDLRSS